MLASRREQYRSAAGTRDPSRPARPEHRRHRRVLVVRRLATTRTDHDQDRQKHPHARSLPAHLGSERDSAGFRAGDATGTTCRIGRIEKRSSSRSGRARRATSSVSGYWRTRTRIRGLGAQGRHAVLGSVAPTPRISAARAVHELAHVAGPVVRSSRRSSVGASSGGARCRACARAGRGARSTSGAMSSRRSRNGGTRIGNTSRR